MRYPALDGLRGIAVTAVLINHLLPATLPDGQWWLLPFVGVSKIGWAGVDLFFVLSGFLITRILLEHRYHPHYFTSFYAHRALRILPLYYLLLISVTVVAPVIGIYPPPNGPVWPYALFVSNMSVFVSMAWSPLIALSWTLSIEEQFYVFWAPAVRFLERRSLARLVIGLILAGLAVRCLVLITPPKVPPGKAGVLAGFTFTRLDGLCLGILASLAFDEPRWRSWLVPFARTWWVWVLAVGGVLVTDQITGWPNVGNNAQMGMVRVGFTFMALMFAAIMVHGLMLDGWVRRFCDLSFLTQLGAWSYFIYLFCEPIDGAVGWMIHVTVGELGVLPRFALSCIAVFALAELSRRYVEGPLQAYKRFFPYVGLAPARGVYLVQGQGPKG